MDTYLLLGTFFGGFVSGALLMLLWVMWSRKDEWDEEDHGSKPASSIDRD